MESGELALLNDTLLALVDRADGATLTKALDDFGWLDLVSDDASTAVPILFGAQGRSVAWSSALHDVLGARLCELDADVSLTTSTVLVPRPGSFMPGRVGPDGIAVEGLLLGARSTTEFLIAACFDAAGGPSIVCIPIRDASVRTTVGLDRAIRVQRVSAAGDGARVLASGELADQWWSTSVASARRALSHQLSGVLTTMLELARTHSIERRQFGRPIGSFQAVMHKLAEAFVAVEGANAAASMAWESDDDVLAAMTAKLVAGRACTTVAAHAQQVLAGVGFTQEHPYHRAMKRAVVIDRLLGSSDELAPLVGSELILRGCAPRLVEL